MAMNRRTARILGAAAAGTAALVTLRELKKVRHRKEEERQAAIDAALVRNRDYGSRRAYLIGGGLASMAAAAYLIRDCNFPGSHITIYEGTHILGGGNDGAGTPEKGYVCRLSPYRPWHFYTLSLRAFLPYGYKDFSPATQKALLWLLYY